MPNYTPETDLGWRGIIYPAGRPTIIPDDLAAALGVGITPPPIDDSPTPPELPASLSDAVARLEELEGLYITGGWQAIKAIGDSLGVAKHPDGWDSSLLRIIEAEFSPDIAAALAQDGDQ